MQAISERIDSLKELPPHKKIYFASDFHLGIPSHEESTIREKKIIRWLEHVSHDASAIFLVGDLFDFWFEYQTVIPKGFVRFQAKLAELTSKGIQVFFFAGNHDYWVYDYFSSELGIKIYKKPLSLSINHKKFFIAHGDGLGKGDVAFKWVKSIFSNGFFQWLFKWIHPDVGMSIAQFWSKKSRLANGQYDEQFKGEKERLWLFTKKIHQTDPHDFYVFGHRHLPLSLSVGDHAMYYNLGEWVSQYNYLCFDGKEATLNVFED